MRSVPSSHISIPDERKCTGDFCWLSFHGNEVCADGNGR